MPFGILSLPLSVVSSTLYFLAGAVEALSLVCESLEESGLIIRVVQILIGIQICQLVYRVLNFFSILRLIMALAQANRADAGDLYHVLDSAATDTTCGQGHESTLVRRTAHGSPVWVAIKGDRSFERVNVQQRPRVTLEPKDNIVYDPFGPPLNDLEMQAANLAAEEWLAQQEGASGDQMGARRMGHRTGMGEVVVRPTLYWAHFRRTRGARSGVGMGGLISLRGSGRRWTDGTTIRGGLPVGAVWVGRVRVFGGGLWRLWRPLAA